MKELFLAADSGGSKTVWRAINTHGETAILLHTEGMGSLPGVLDVEHTVRSAFSALERVSFSGIFLSLGGPNEKEVGTALRTVWPDVPVIVSREANGDAILRAASFLSCSSVVLCGTGSTAVGLKDGRRRYAGGWGPVYGDGGSGGGLCRDALALYLRSLDGTAGQSDLSPVFDFITEGLDITDFEQRMEAKRRATALSRQELAALLPSLYMLYLRKAPSAVLLFDEAVNEVCRLAAEVSENSPDTNVLICGGFFRGKPELTELCAKNFIGYSSARMIYDYRFDPIAGACVAVLDAFGEKPNAAVFENILNEKRAKT